MRKSQIEAWALAAIERVGEGQRIEDSRVEAKAVWKDAIDLARRLAAHLNASRGEPILWLIGVDEDAGTVPGVDASEFSNWYSQLVACFDELAPEVVEVKVPFGGVTVDALYFETDRAPFVVKNQAGGQIEREIPWRDGQRTKSATRSQLLRLLTPVSLAPKLEVVTCRTDAEKSTPPNGAAKWNQRWEVRAKLFVDQAQGQESVFAVHRSLVTVSHRIGDVTLPAVVFSHSESGAENEIISLTGSRYFNVRAYRSVDSASEPTLDSDDVTINLSFDVPGVGLQIKAGELLPRIESIGSRNSAWEVDRSPPPDTRSPFLILG
jgi:hypothetical protein